MTKTVSSKSCQTANTPSLKRIKNTFAPNCTNEYLTPAMLFCACKYGFPYNDLPDEAKKMLDEYCVEYKKCAMKRGKVVFPDIPDDIQAVF